MAVDIYEDTYTREWIEAQRSGAFEITKLLVELGRHKLIGNIFCVNWKRMVHARIEGDKLFIRYC